MAWKKAQTKDTARAYDSFLRDYPSSEHAEEARSRLFALEFRSVTRPEASAKAKQRFIATYPRTEEEAMVSIDLEYPAVVMPTGPAGNPTWSFRIVFHERNGILARIQCTSLKGINRVLNWRSPMPPRCNISLPANGTRSYSSWVSRESLKGSSTTVTFRIENEKGHSTFVAVPGLR